MKKRVLFWTAAVLLVAGLTVYACGKEKDKHYTVQVLSESGAIVYHTEEIDI